jgi:hypothetical protein
VRIDTTTADASPASSDYLMLRYKFEGQDLQLVKKGTANAEKLTLAFWVKSNKTGNAQVNLFDNDTSGNRIVGATYSISSADTWEHKVVNFPADTTGALDDDNGKSFLIEWFLDSGTDYSSGTAPAAWEAKDNTDRNASGALAIADSDANDWAITGIQLEVGEYTSSTIPPFQHESYGDNLRRCQRYCYNTNQNNTLYAALSVGAATWTGGVYGELYFPVTMRDNPSGSVVQSTDYWALNANNATDTFDNILVQNCSTTQGTIYCTGNVSQTVGHASRIRNNNTAARLLVVSEL